MVNFVSWLFFFLCLFVACSWLDVGQLLLPELVFEPARIVVVLPLAMLFVWELAVLVVTKWKRQ